MMQFLKRALTGVLAVLHTRAELLSAEVEGEVRRILLYFALIFLAVICFAFALFFVALFIILALWKLGGTLVVASVAIFFAIVALVLLMCLRQSYRNKPKMLSATLSELSKDLEVLKSVKAKNTDERNS